MCGNSKNFFEQMKNDEEKKRRNPIMSRSFRIQITRSLSHHHNRNSIIRYLILDLEQLFNFVCFYDLEIFENHKTIFEVVFGKAQFDDFFLF